MKKNFLIGCFLLLTGCASASPKINYIELTRQRIVQGESTKEDVLRLLGKPQSKMVMDYQMPVISNSNVDMSKVMPYEMWTYSWLYWDMHNEKPGLKGFFGRTVMDQEIKTLVFNFDRGGKVTGYTTNETSI